PGVKNTKTGPYWVIGRKKATMTRLGVTVMETILRLAVFAIGLAVAHAAEEPRAPEKTYQGEMAAYPGPWAFELPKEQIILVSDEELETLAANPDKVLDLSLTPQPKHLASLRQVCEAAKRQGARTLIVAFDHFFQ